MVQQKKCFRHPKAQSRSSDLSHSYYAFPPIVWQWQLIVMEPLRELQQRVLYWICTSFPTLGLYFCLHKGSYYFVFYSIFRPQI